MYAETAAGTDQQNSVMGVDARALAHAVPVGIHRVCGDGGGLVVESIRNFQIVFARQRDKCGKPPVAVNADISAEIFAQRLSAAATPPAMSAHEVEINRGAIANFHVGHTLADGDNVASQFMPHYAGRRAPEPAAAHVE